MLWSVRQKRSKNPHDGAGHLTCRGVSKLHPCSTDVILQKVVEGIVYRNHKSIVRPPEARRVEAKVRPVCDLPADALAALVAESDREVWRFVRWFADDLRSEANRFDRPGAGLWLAEVGVCGLNIDPFGGEPAVGRVRRPYVLAAYHGVGVGRRLVEAVVSAASGRFRRLRVRTENAQAGRPSMAVQEERLREAVDSQDDYGSPCLEIESVLG